jgi:hypothetical protein
VQNENTVIEGHKNIYKKDEIFLKSLLPYPGLRFPASTGEFVENIPKFVTKE